MEFKHEPILKDEIIEFLRIKEDGNYLDCTIGGAGHSLAIISKLKNGHLYGIDKDIDALNVCKERLKGKGNFALIHDDFKNVEGIFKEHNLPNMDGVLIDLGISSYQIDNPERGFSFLRDGPLDMRMNQEQEFSAYDVVNNYSYEELVKIFYEYGEESFAKPIAKRIVEERLKKPIETTKELNDIIESALPKKVVYKSGGCAKKVFQAIRIEVNGELSGLKDTLQFLIKKLNTGGRICVLSFHSLEDRIVKEVFKTASIDCLCPPNMPICVCGHKKEVSLVTKKPLTASEEEMKRNSRSTCAKLRVAQKL